MCIRDSGYTKAVATMVQENRPYALLFGGTDEGRDLAPRVAARTRTGLTVDCTEFRIDEEDVYKRQLGGYSNKNRVS